MNILKILLCLVALLPAFAQDVNNLTYQDAMEVRIIRVEAVVTDKDGERVKGLDQDAFRLLVNDEPTTLAYFREVDDFVYDGSVQDLPAGIESLDPMDDPAAHEGVSYLVFFDDYFTKRNFRQSLIDRIEMQLNLMRPQDEMAIVRFDGTRLHALTQWTQSQDVLRNALREIRRTKPGELRREARLSTPSQNLSFIKSTDNYHSAMQILSSQIKEAVSAAAVSMRSISDPRGRKVMMLATTGWPHRLARDPQNPTSTVSLEHRFLGQELLAPLYDTANLLSYTIYPLQVDTPGSSSSASNLSYESEFSPFANSYDINYESLSLLAEETGGRLIHNAGSKRTPFEEVVNDTTSYYVLAFYVPDGVEVGERQAIEIEMLDDDLKVRHREHYKIQAEAVESRMEIEAALLLNQPRLDMSIHLAAPERGWTTMKQTFWLKIPADQLAIKATADGQYRADVDLRIMVEDKRGDRSPLSEIPLSFVVKERPEEGKFFVYNATLKLRKVKHNLVFTVTDRNGDAALMLNVPYDPEMFKNTEG